MKAANAWNLCYFEITKSWTNNVFYKCLKHKKRAVILFLALRKDFLSSLEISTLLASKKIYKLSNFCHLVAWGSFVLCLENEMVVFYVAI